MKMKAVRTPGDLDAEEEVEGTHVLERELVVDGADDVVQDVFGGGVRTMSST
jgi:hypothetical protein